MQLSHDEVKKAAQSARLKLSDSELEALSHQLSSILSAADQLKEVDTSGVEPIAQIPGLKNVSFEDEVESCEKTEALLAQSPQKIQDNMIKVKNVF